MLHLRRNFQRYLRWLNRFRDSIPRNVYELQEKPTISEDEEIDIEPFRTPAPQPLKNTWHKH